MTTAISDKTRAEYDAIRSDVAILPHSNAAILAVRGADRADFLHRMTTNDINGLRSGGSTVTVLTSPTARILFVFTVLYRPEELLLLPAPGQSDELAAHLRSQIFFMDQVNVHAEPYSRWRVVGPRAAQILKALGVLPDDTSDGQAWEVDGILVVCQEQYGIPGFELLAPPDAGEPLLAGIVADGAVLLSDKYGYDVRRVELGRPAPHHELTEEYSPLEVGLAWACSDTKGCYTGQEIIARQITYDKVTKSLVGLLCAGEVADGDTIRYDGKRVGNVTSAAYSPAHEQHIALAVVHRPHTAAGTVVSIEREDVHYSNAQVIDLPFDA